MPLTPEQRARMEANKAQALAKRRAQPPSASSSALTSHGPPNVPPPTPRVIPSTNDGVKIGRKLLGSCALEPNRRFRVQIGFHDTLIQVRKERTMSLWDGLEILDRS